ncbi:unnamed protein product [Prorocentrum cordatum]|uniref:Uncharacterized protein n=1 Tax=Prorocentrum cordatum TaxID=2364126 RepID=A0ABN9X4F8_9DINO|nr:unnamed protein product [Polarella glacialis]
MPALVPNAAAAMATATQQSMPGTPPPPPPGLEDGIPDVLPSTFNPKLRDETGSQCSTEYGDCQAGSHHSTSAHLDEQPDRYTPGRILGHRHAAAPAPSGGADAGRRRGVGGAWPALGGIRVPPLGAVQAVRLPAQIDRGVQGGRELQVLSPLWSRRKQEAQGVEEGRDAHHAAVAVPEGAPGGSWSVLRAALRFPGSAP